MTKQPNLILTWWRRHARSGAGRGIATLGAIALLLASLSAPGSRLIAQPRGADGDRILLGPVAEYDFALPLTLHPAADAAGVCDCDGSGTSYGTATSGGADLLLPSLFARGLGIDLRMTYGAASGTFTSAPYNVTVALPQPTIRRDRFYVDASAKRLAMELLIDITTRNGLSVALGPSVELRTKESYTEREEIESPTGDVFAESGTNSRVVATGSNLATSSMMPGATLRFAYRMRLGSLLALRPALQVRGDLDALRSNAKFNAFSFGAGLSLLFDLSGDDPPTPAPNDTAHIDSTATHAAPPAIAAAADTMRAAPPEVKPDSAAPPEAAHIETPHPFAATLDIYGFDDAGGVTQALSVRRTTLYQRQYTPFLPLIFFARDSAALPSRYIRYGSAAERFTFDSLARRDARAVYYQELNVMGLRMRADRDATITLLGGRASSEPERLAIARAAEVRRYLVESWGIDSTRIALRARPGKGNMAADRSVTIVSASKGITAMIRTEWVVQDLHAPQIGLDPGSNGGAGMKRWDIAIRQAGREVAHYSSDGATENRELDFSLVAVEDGGHASPEPLVAEMIAEDSSGTLAAVRDQLPLLVSDEPRDVADGEPFKTTYLFYPSDSTGDLADSALRASLMNAINEGDQITLTYPKETPAHPRAATHRVAEKLDALLGELGVSVDKVGVVGQGAPEASDPAALPEDRAFASQVSLVIEGRKRK